MHEQQKTASRSKTQAVGATSDSKGPSTPNLLDWAQNFEKASKQQASDTEKAVESDYEKLRRFSQMESRKSADSIRNDFQGLSQSLSGLILKSWSLMLFGLIAIGLLGYGALWWTGEQITKNLETIANQKQTIQKLKAQGGAIKMNYCEGRLCVQIDETAIEFQHGYRVLEGY